MSNTDASLLDTGLQGNDGQPQTAAPKQPTYTEQLPGEVRDNEIWGKYPKLGDVATTFIDMHKKLEAAVFKPGEDAGEDEKAAYLNALGRPESPEGYEFSYPEGLPDHLKPDTEYVTELREKFHNMGLTAQQAQNLMDELNKLSMQGEEGIKKALKERKTAAEKDLRDTWGDKAQENLEIARRAIEKFGGEGIRDSLKADGLDNNPAFYKIVYNMASQMREDASMGPIDKGTQGMRRTAAGTPMLKFKGMEGQT